MPQDSCYMIKKNDPALNTTSNTLMPTCLEFVYSDESYHTPVEVAIGDQVSTFDYSAYQPWGIKAYVEDGYMPLPSARLEML